METQEMVLPPLIVLISVLIGWFLNVDSSTMAILIIYMFYHLVLIIRRPDLERKDKYSLSFNYWYPMCMFLLIVLARFLLGGWLKKDAVNIFDEKPQWPEFTKWMCFAGFSLFAAYAIYEVVLIIRKPSREDGDWARVRTNVFRLILCVAIIPWTFYICNSARVFKKGPSTEKTYGLID